MVDSRTENDSRRKANEFMSNANSTDEGSNPFVTNIETDSVANENYRTTRWTGSHLQMTLMCIEPGHDIGLEVHHDGDQFLRVETGTARVQMGSTENELSFDREVGDDWAILVPAGMWHNVTNIGDEPLKVYAIYGPPEHPHGTVHPTQADAQADEHHH
jgi:mannose-6-phosphate isomerase-like protein (cupin superfamily)